MLIGTAEVVLFYIGRDGLGWRIGDTWYRLRPPWMRSLFSERYGNAVIWRAFGWRIAKRQTGRPWFSTATATTDGF